MVDVNAQLACSMRAARSTTLPNVCRARQVRLVVVDSVPFQFRQDRQDVGERTRLLSHIGQSLMAIAGRHDICVRA